MKRDQKKIRGIHPFSFYTLFHGLLDCFQASVPKTPNLAFLCVLLACLFYVISYSP